MYKRSNIRPVSVVVCKGSRPFDTFDEMGYTINSNGFIRNDFSDLQERENDLAYYRALSQMQEYVSEHSNAGKTFEEIVKEVRPRWCQLNGEVDRFEQFLIDNALDFYKKLRDESTLQGKVAKEVAEGEGTTVTSQPAVVS